MACDLSITYKLSIMHTNTNTNTNNNTNMGYVVGNTLVSQFLSSFRISTTFIINYIALRITILLFEHPKIPNVSIDSFYTWTGFKRSTRTRTELQDSGSSAVEDACIVASDNTAQDEQLECVVVHPGPDMGVQSVVMQLAFPMHLICILCGHGWCLGFKFIIVIMNCSMSYVQKITRKKQLS